MSLRPTAKKQKLLSSAEKLRPPPLISDYNSGLFNLFSYIIKLQKFTYKNHKNVMR